ncbi:hypothetical protein CANCADRAFT_75413 [Tortispora caseinolytica NRRL Y-17796]|uniref:Uncharacterized protein n=1 Tax=Tortispora caseinolytica NRRL Y-17796 TaxID=767744 RepID=A0A1E4TJ01_9ASCO|nr:hypothetical protein CANCADRAFT_75413 [Tortispora caseinolytica NRRL Y-17796]
MSVLPSIIADLNTLASEARRNSELQIAAEASMAEIQALQVRYKDDKSVLSVLASKPHFTAPFFIACISTKSQRSLGVALRSMHRLVQTSAVSTESLDALQEALQSAASVGSAEDLLKVIQTLPPLLENYPDHSTDTYLGKLFRICIAALRLKSSVVRSTANATIQQMVMLVFDRVTPADTFEKTIPLNIDSNSPIYVTHQAYDAYRLFYDLSLFVQHPPKKSQYFDIPAIPEGIAFELIETILTNHYTMFLSHKEFIFIVQTSLVPAVMTILADATDFPSVLRAARIMYMLILRLIPAIPEQCHMLLSLVAQIFDNDGLLPWKYCLCLEACQGIISEFSLVLELFTLDFDGKPKTPAIINLIVSFTRLSEKFFNFSLERSSSQSSILIDLPEITSVETMKQEPMFSSKVLSSCAPSIDQLDKSDPPNFPSEYLYYLLITCINVLCDGTQGYVSHFSSVLLRKQTQMHANEHAALRKSSVSLALLNPEFIQNDEALATVSQFIMSSWMYIMRIQWNYLRANIDFDLYHSIVRASQKLCQSAGIVQLNKVRNTLIYEISYLTLGSNKVEIDEIFELGNTNPTTWLTDEQFLAAIETSNSLRVTGHNILTIRALVNLSLFLGPVLGDLWYLILDTLEKTNYLIITEKRRPAVRHRRSSSSLLKPPESQPTESFDTEALDAAELRLPHVWKSFPSNRFIDLISLLFSSVTETSLKGSHSSSSNSTTVASSQYLSHKMDFYLAKLKAALLESLERVDSEDTDHSIWDNISSQFFDVLSSHQKFSPGMRLSLTQIYNICIFQLFCLIEKKPDNSSNAKAITYLFQILEKEIKAISEAIASKTISEKDFAECADSLIDTMNNLNEILNQVGVMLTVEWSELFNLMNHVLEILATPPKYEQNHKMEQFTQAAFKSVGLICNDFLSSLDPLDLKKFVIILCGFAQQSADINIALAASSFFWLVSDHISRQITLNGEKLELSTLFSSLDDAIKFLESHEDKHSQFCALWFILLYEIVQISSLPRTEIRNSAIPIFFGVIESQVKVLGPNSWKSCLNMIIINGILAYPSDKYGNGTSVLESISLILSGISQIMADYVASIPPSDEFNEVLIGILDYFSRAIGLHTTAINSHVFKAFSTILDVINQATDISIDAATVRKCWMVWEDSSIYEQHDLTVDLAGYHLGVFKHLLKLSRTSNYEFDAQESLVLFEKALIFPYDTAITSDLQRPSVLQNSVLSLLKDLLKDKENTAMVALRLISLSILPFTKGALVRDKQTKGDPTYLALSVQALKIFKELYENPESKARIMESNVNYDVLSLLLVPVGGTLKETVEIRATAIKLFTQLVEGFLTIQHHDHSSDFWKTISRFLVSILSSGHKLKEMNVDEHSEEQDFEYLTEVFTSLNPQILRGDVPEKEMILLVNSFYEQSFLSSTTEVALGLEKDFPFNELAKAPLFGRSLTKKAGETKCCIFCFNELVNFALKCNVKLYRNMAYSRAAWKCAVILRWYWIEQPLRGRQPLLRWQKDDLTETLNIVARACVSDRTAAQEFGKLVPFITRCLSVPRVDQDILRPFEEVLKQIYYQNMQVA